MHEIPPRDGDRVIDWGKTSADYAAWRPGYPESFFERVKALGVGLAGQRLLDLGTGTGVLARRFARQGCRVVGVDVSEAQLAAARRLAVAENVVLELKRAPAEETGLPDASFDVITASQCWLYFDRERIVPEVRRLLAPEGVLMTCHLSWLPRRDVIACTSEELVLKHNPQWTAADFSGRVPPAPEWVGEDFDVKAMFFYDERIPFTRESWRGRFRACRAIGATLDEEAVGRFDAEHAEILEIVTPGEAFTVLHRVDAHLLVPREAEEMHGN